MADAARKLQHTTRSMHAAFGIISSKASSTDDEAEPLVEEDGELVAVAASSDGKEKSGGTRRHWQGKEEDTAANVDKMSPS